MSIPFSFSIPTRSLLLAIIIVAGIATAANSQNQITILEADSIIGGTIRGEQVQKILGHVHLESDEFEIFCDSAYKFQQKSEIRAFGNIEINTADENIWADTLVYFSDVDFSQLRGRVIIATDTTTLFGNSVDYRFSTKVAHFLDRIRLEDHRGTLKADSGFYYREADSTVFHGNVQLADSLQYIEGDSLFSNRSTEYYELYGDIFADDSENNTLLKGDYLESDSTGTRIVKGNAWLRNVKTDTIRTHPDSLEADTSSIPRTDSLAIPSDSLQVPGDTTYSEENRAYRTESDTTHIRAAKIISIEQKTQIDTANIIHAYQDVRIWSNEFSAISDSAKYNDFSDIFDLWSNAKAWHEQLQLTAPFIRVTIVDKNIDQLFAHPHPFVVQEDTSIGRLNQLKGDTLTAYFENGAMSRMHLQGDSHLLRFTKDEQGKPDGALNSSAPEAMFFFEEGELVKFKHTGSVDGNYLPEEKIIVDRELEGFAWNPEQRPERPPETMESRFPPIPEHPPFTLPKRYREYLKTIEN